MTEFGSMVGQIVRLFRNMNGAIYPTVTDSGCNIPAEHVKPLSNGRKVVRDKKGEYLTLPLAGDEHGISILKIKKIME